MLTKQPDLDHPSLVEKEAFSVKPELSKRHKRTRSRYRKITVPREDGRTIAIYAAPRLGDALEEVVGELSLYEGVRLSQVIEAAYDQGRKDGARQAFAAVRDGINQAENVVPHRLPGRPRKSHF